MPILEKICEEVSRFDHILFVSVNFVLLSSDCLSNVRRTWLAEGLSGVMTFTANG